MPLPTPETPAAGPMPNPSFGMMSENMTAEEVQKERKERERAERIADLEHEVVETAKQHRRAWLVYFQQPNNENSMACRKATGDFATTVDRLLKEEETPA